MGLIFNRRPHRKPEAEEKRDYNFQDLIPTRHALSVGQATPYVTDSMALQNSAVWAALRLRADLVSTMPVATYRNVDERKLKVSDYGIMRDRDFMAWRYSSQVELDHTGNAIGIINSIDSAGYPREIELVASAQVHISGNGSKITNYRIGNEDYKPNEIWHEKQYTVAGLPLGLSPVAYSAWTLGEYHSVEQFVTAWFTSGQTPRARLRNVNRTIDPKEAAIVKESWNASIALGEPFVHGSDWEYDLVQAQEASADWLNAKRYDVVDIARFFGVPANLIDAAIAGESVTYANLVSRELGFLVMHLQPALSRRENAWSGGLVPRPRFVEFNSDTLLRMDPQSRAEWIKTQIESRILSPNEGRALENREPFTDEQIDEFEKLGLNKTATGALTGAADLPVPAGTQDEPLNASQMDNSSQGA